MDELKKLYDVLTREGKYTKSFEEFQTKWNDPTYKDKVYDVVSRDGLYTKDKNEFLTKYSGNPIDASQVVEDPLKKKAQPQAAMEAPMEANVSDITESPSESTSLVSPKPFDKNALLSKGLKQASIATPLEPAPQNKQETKDIAELRLPTNLTSLKSINTAAQEKVKAAQEKVNLRQQIINYQAANPQTKGGGFEALNNILLDPNTSEETKITTTKQIENVNKYLKLDEKVNQINSKIDREETIRQKGLEERYGKVQNAKDLFKSIGIKSFAGTLGIMNTIGGQEDEFDFEKLKSVLLKSGAVENILDTDESTYEESSEEYQIRKEQKAKLNIINEFADSLITQKETPKNWEKLFEGEWSANRVGYVLSQAFGNVAPTVASGFIFGPGGAAVTGAGLAYNESLDMFEKAGLTDKQASLASVALSVPLGVLEEMGVSDIVTKPLFKLMLKETTKEVVASLAKKELTNQALFETVKATFGQKIKEYGKDLIVTGVKEPLTEIEQAVFSEVAGQTAEAYTGKDSNKEQTMAEYLKELGLKVSEEGFYGLVGGVGMSAVTSAVQNRANPTAYGRALELKNDALMNDFKRQLDREVKKGIITKEQATTAIENVHKIQVADNKIPSTVEGNEKRSQVASLLGIKESLQSEIEGKDKSLTGPVQAAIDDIDAKLKGIAIGREEEVVPEVKGVLATPETTTTALEALPTKEKENSTFTDNEGTVLPVTGNEKQLADLFHEAQMVSEEDRTPSQQSAIDAVEVSLKTPLDLESEVERLQEEFPMSEAENEINKLNNNEEYVRTANSLDEVPVEFRDRVKESTNTMGGTARKTFFGIPYGKETKVTFPKTYTYIATGKELKSSFDAAMKTEMQAAVAPTTDTGVSVTNKSSLETIKSGLTDAMKIKVINSAEKAVKTLKSIFPNFDMVIHEDEGSYNAAVQKEQGALGTSGNFSVRRNAEGVIVGGKIDINLSKATTTTVAHELAHSALLYAFGDNPALFKSFRDNIYKILKEDTNKKLTEFANQYKGEVKHEEYLVQLTALIEQEQENISTTTYQKIAALINKFVSSITAGQIKVFEKSKDTKELIDFLNSTATAIRGGKEITTKTNDKKNNAGVQGDLGKGQESKQAKSDKGTSKEKTSTGRNVQTYEEEVISKSQINGKGKNKREGNEPTKTSKGEVRSNGRDVIGERSRTESEKDASRAEAKEKIILKGKNNPLNIANKYNEIAGLLKIVSHKFKPSNKEEQTKIGKVYEKLQDVLSPTYKETELETEVLNGYKEKYPELIKKYNIKSYKDLVEKSYEELSKEVEAQFNLLPIKIDFHTGEKNYESSTEMLDDVHNFEHLWVFKGGEDHPLTGSKTLDKNGLTVNDKFRAVHDYFGHSLNGYQFGKDGEENAWIEHSKMFSPLAQLALSSETRGQNSVVNYSGINDVALEKMRISASLLKKGLAEKNSEMIAESKLLLEEANNEFQYADQKAIILPEEYTNADRYFKGTPTSKSQVASEVKELEQSFPLSKSQVEVWHGSPYKFDRFTTEKIGDGEGAQAFGWGLYFTDVRNIAKHYANAIASKKTQNNDIPVFADIAIIQTGTKNKADLIKNLTPKLTDGIHSSIAVQKAIDYVNNSTQEKLNKLILSDNISTNIYEVSLHKGKTPDQYTWMEWDKPLSNELSKKIPNGTEIVKSGNSSGSLVQLEKKEGKWYEVRKSFNFNNGKYTIASETELKDNINGKDFYQYLSFDKGSDKAASLFLLENGIDGIKYPAESISRGATSDTARGSNYVVFDENAVTINTVSKAQQKAVNAINKIIKDARGQGFSEEAIKTFLESKGLTSQESTEAMDAETSASKKIVLSEETMPGYDRMMGQVDGIIEKSDARGVDKAKTLENVINYVQGSKVYENATDVQREKLMRDIDKMFGKSQKSAPSANIILGTVSDVNSITMTEAALLSKQIKDYAKGAKNTKAAWIKASTQLTKDIKELVGTGKITVKQAANVLRRFSNVNVFSEKSIGKFVEYMTKVFNNAEYANQISIANKTKKAISVLSRNKDKNANLRALGKQFLELDPSLIEDIYAYNEKATELKNALDGSKMKSGNVNFSQTVNIESLSEYIKTNVEAQNKILLEEKIAEIQELMGIDASNFTEAEINALLQEDKEVNKSDEVAIKDTIKKMFDIYSTLIKEVISSGIDPFTGESRTFTQKQQDLISRFMEMNLNNLNAKQSLAAVDSLINFFQNDSTARMEAVLSEYTGKENARKLVEKGIKSIPLSKWFMKSFGRGLAEQTYNLNILFERMFKGVKSGAFVEKMSGITNLINKKAYAQAQSNGITNQYVAEFFKKEANGEAFNTSANNAERGISAFLQRNVIGTEEEISEDFNRRKELVGKTITDLANGNEKEQVKSEIYEKAYEKFKDAENVQEVIDATDKVNLEAIQFWQNKWSEKYDELADVSLNVYNKVLERDTNYTPDRFVKLSLNIEEDTNISNNESNFHRNNGTLYKKEAGVLQKAVKPTKDNTENVMDFSFDKNNANSMYDALIDMNTAAAVRQVEAFLKSDDFKKIFNADDAKVLTKRINLYVKNIRKKNAYTNDELTKLVKALNKLSAIGVGQALAGPTQAIKQVGPVMLNTLINAGTVDLKSSLEPSFLDFLKNSGYAIAIRGIESQGSIDSISKIIKEQSKGLGNKAVDKITGLNEWMLKSFLARPDVFIARASWKSYYEKDLKKQGIDPNSIDYSKHQINEDAANYAQKMVDRQQNISDTDMAGNLFTDKTATNQILMKVFMPLASFRMNQAARLGSDLNVLTSTLSTKEDKRIAALSLTGFSVEMAAYKILSTYIGVWLGDFTKWLMDDDEDEEERKKRIDNIIKGQATSTVTDVISPLPVLDPLLQYGAAWMTKTTQDVLETEEEERVSLYEPKAKDMAEQFGLFGIPLIRGKQLWDITRLAYEGTYTDNYGKEKEITEENQDALKKLLPVALLTNLGLAPVEANTVVRNAIKFAKAKSSSTSEGTTSPSNPKKKSSSDEESYKEKELTKTEMKKYNPDKYEMMYGEGSAEYYKDELLKDKAKRLAEKRKEMLENRYGY